MGAPTIINLDALTRVNATGVPLDAVIETAWAITHHIYTNDNEVKFIRHLSDSRTASVVRSFLLEHDSSPEAIAKHGCQVVHVNGRPNTLNLDPSAPSYTLLVRRLALIILSQDGSPSNLESDQDSFTLRIVVDNKTVRGNFVAKDRTHDEFLSGIAETIQLVSETIAENWTLPLSQMKFLGPENWKRLARDAPETAVIGPSVMRDILDHWSANLPNKIAVEAWDGELTYSELHESATKLGQVLIQAGVGFEERVGICMKKSKWSIITFWGLLLAGITGVPLDVRNPKKRTSALLARVEARFVIADDWTAPGLEGIETGIIRCNADTLAGSNRFESVTDRPPVTPQTVAFILFTSGSTGFPKAVTVEHGPLYGSTVEIARELYLEQSSKSFQFASFVSDISMGDIFSTMFKGGCIYVPSEEDRLSNLQFVLEKCQATHAALTSTVMSQLNPEKLTHLRYMIAVGEAISKENTVRWRPYVHMISAYGIAESIIYDSFASPENLASDYRSIGLAKGPCVWVTSIHDPEKLLPFGAVGEIVIEGPLLARGYMGDPQKTAERFIQAPSWLKAYRGERDDHRCYRSGDYGIKNPDGTTLYLGRADTQVKIRGQRVELGEIAFCLLNAEPSLGQVAVEAITLQSRGDTQTLAAFCKRPAGDLDASGPSILPLDEETKALFIDVQSKLVEFLPQYMVPSLFIPVNDIPKNAAGKRDRITLLQWGAALTEEQISDYQLRTSSAEAAPETSAEKLLHRVWARVLRAPESSFGTRDNFFQAGGDSVKVIELLAALREQGKKITVAEVFQHPNMQEMAEHLVEMDETDKDCTTKPFELFPGGRDNAIQQVAHACEVGTDAIEDIYPTTPLQEALMAISAQKAEAYTHRTIFSVPETLDIGRFQQACEKLVAEHSIFRTAILTLPDVGAVQVVLRSKIKWHEFETLDDMVHFDSITPFSYGSALCRYALVRAEQNVTHFVWSGHHSISDGWSRPAMFDELRHIYEHGTAHPQVPFTSFIKHVSRLDLDESDGFWREQFPDSVEQFPKLPAPGYTPRAEASGDISFSLGRREKSQITMATVLQAAWALVLGTYSNLDEAVFGLTLSGRDAPVPGITETMGVTITTVPVRIVFDNTSTIVEYLQEVQQYVSTIKNHQHVGLQRIQRLSPEARSATRFENLLVVQPVDEAEDHKALEDLGLRLIKREERDTDQYALTVKCTIGNADGSVHVKAHYDESILGRKLMHCLLHQFKHLAIHLAAESDEVSLHDLDRMSAHDLDLLAQWNGHVPVAVEQTLHGQFQERAAATPTAIALDGFDSRLTYEELDAQSAQLGHYLHNQVGVDLESRVILCFGKSKIPIISMLAVLKSGGVCVSINPEHPTPRLVEMIHDAEANVVLCDQGSVDRFKDHATHVVGVSESFIAKLNMTVIPGEPKLPHVAPSNASFVVFTSGSTGKPKGSLLEHRSLATDMDAVGERIGLDARSRTLQFSSYTFDAHILEIFGTLLRGGCVCVISDSERMNRLSEVMNERQVNFALLTKTVSRLLDPEKLPTLKSLILSGEANGRQDYWRWAERVKLFNGLGPSECTPLVCLTRDRVARDDDPANIGHPLACSIWITDHRRRDRLVPIGRVGELTVEGPIVGRGYINRPRENAASFFADPSWSRDGSGRTRRFYRSGDLARMNADGSITFLGRVDNQVKIHGQRVELGEIEDQLRRCSPAFVASAVDTVKMSSRGGATALVVFYAAGQEGQKTARLIESASPILDLDEASEQQFRAAQANLMEALPSYMVPSLFIPVTHLPFNASGKLERDTLRNWVSALSAVQLGQYYLSDRTSLREPETKSEKHLQSLWAKVLEIPLNTIHAEDNFFRLGGDSVLSMRLIADARAEGLSMTVAEVFKTPVLQDLAESVSDRYEIQDAGLSGKVPYEPFSLLKDKASVDDCIKQAAEDCNVSLDMIEDIYPSTPTQEALMAVSSHRPKAYTYQVILKIPTSMDIGLFQSTWEKMVSDRAIFRTRIIFRRGVGSLQTRLPEKLPQYMIPSAFIPIAFIPTSASTKVERKRLREYAQNPAIEAYLSSENHVTKEQPRSGIESTLHLIWSQVLNLRPDEIGINENFTSLGGDSITAMQVVSECRKHGVKLQGTDSPNLKVNDAKHQQEFRGTVEQLKQALASVLPQYMVPSAYIPVSRIPITPSAKTDKKLLREFALGLTIEAAFMQDTALAKQQPTNEVEQELQNIWVKVLNVPAEKIGIHDSFMSIGGDSITAMRVVALCRKAHLKLPVSAILQKKTIAAIAPHCERDMNGLSNTALDNAPQDTWFDLTPIQKRYFEQESKDGRIQYNQSLMLRLKRDVTTETLRAAFDLIVSRHGMLRARFEIQDAPENVQDMLPTSPFQRFALQGHLDDPPRHWTHYYFELPHDVDVGKLRNTCANLVKHYSILRTIFVQHGDEFVQIVLKSYEPKIDYSYEETEDITTLMETIFHRDIGLLPPLGGAFLRFAIIQTPTRCRLLMRLSHAQFDGFSRVSFVKTLANLYHDPNYSANSLDYAEFIQQAGRNRAQSSDFWRNLLLGSHPTSVLNIKQNATAKGTVIRVEKTIPPFRKLEGITSATFFNAACAILVQTLTNASDVTFCRFASGRGGLDAKFQELVGPCANLVPLRVRFPQGYQTEASHVFEQIHEQSIKSISHEAFGLDDIIRECTDWSTSMATFPIITQHLNLEEGSESELDGAFSANVWEPETADPFPWSLALGAFPGRAGVNVSIAVNSNYMERAMVEKIHEGLCQVIGEISRGGLD
ncbi:unnamed protein product [Clonostachys solani]|uniref:Carrier domain-containing protein n=1 Tax=Clonostachys solani TaxID=160281 RepID=A0A9N9ZF26_9HYPO|nr:unnamed protein product [Clonostachys solani]